MSASIAAEIWQEIKRYVNQVDRQEAAEVLVNLLVDNDINVDDIRMEFKGDSDIKRALTHYLDEHASDEDYYDEDDDEDDDDY